MQGIDAETVFNQAVALMADIDDLVREADVSMGVALNAVLGMQNKILSLTLSKTYGFEDIEYIQSLLTDEAYDYIERCKAKIMQLALAGNNETIN